MTGGGSKEHNSSQHVQPLCHSKNDAVDMRIQLKQIPGTRSVFVARVSGRSDHGIEMRAIYEYSSTVLLHPKRYSLRSSTIAANTLPH